ncbi:alpha/beta hydrolase [Streptomyces sp. NPDC058371]|uniref:alpha/beta hydrolase n=1 Tax=Streptomyces sp. NPDC058371 TaxID=3346463 RepID=UPI00366963D0
MVSTITWQQLRDLKLSELSDAAEAWGAASRHADSARERVDGEMNGGIAKTQESESARAAVKRLKRLSENYHYIKTECGLIRGTVDGLATELAAPRKSLHEALNDAAALGYTVNENGSIDYPAGGKLEGTSEDVPGGTAYGQNGHFDSSNPGPSSGEKGLYQPGLGEDGRQLKSPNPHYSKAKDIADRISHALLSAQEIDARYSGSLRKLKSGPGLIVDTKTWADVASDVDTVGLNALPYLKSHIPFDESPGGRKRWWDQLTERQREEYIAAFPGVIGNLDGVPAATRDEANRESLKFLIADLKGEDNDRSRGQLEGLMGIQKKLDEPSNPPMLLLGVGSEGNGRAIVSYGNPDTSRNVSSYVPGLGTALDADFADDTVRRAFQTAKGAYKYDHSSASIVWLGYDAPGIMEVGSTSDAEKGAPAYREFMAGIEATNENEDPHITAIGHSYGSLLVGTAARSGDGIPGADDIVLLGSPGTGAQTADELNVGRGHVFAASAGNDPVSWLPPATSLLGPVPAFVNFDDGENYFGRDPVSKEFGATRIESGDGPLPVLSGEGATPAHSGYFDSERNPSAAENIARIVAGRSDAVMTEEPR